MKEKIVSTLKNDGLVIMQTDTLFGILGLASSKRAVAKIFDVKGRSNNKPLIVFISSVDEIKGFGIRSLPEGLNDIWPNQITVIMPCKLKKYEYIHRGKNSIAFRMPDNKMLLSVLRETGPLVAPSANPQGEKPAKNVTEARKYFGEEIDLYVPSSAKGNHLPSTILKYTDRKWKVIREGAIKQSSKILKSLIK